MKASGKNPDDGAVACTEYVADAEVEEMVHAAIKWDLGLRGDSCWTDNWEQLVGLFAIPSIEELGRLQGALEKRTCLLAQR